MFEIKMTIEIPGLPEALNALAGQVMKASRGKANPGQVQEILRQKLA